MTKSKKITLSASRDIPFNKLLLSQSNVRQIKSGVSIEELAEDIARRTLLASLTVRPVLDEEGGETGMFEIPAGGRRFLALELLVKQRRLNKTAPVPCIVRTDGLAEEDSLAENVQRAPLHPLDQFRAFRAMREKGKSEEEIAAAFFVSAGVVKQRLKLAAVSAALLDAYAEEQMTLDQLMAFTVNPDHERQEQVWEALKQHYSKQPYEIRRMLTEGAVRASDRRAQFVGLDNYVEAGGEILRDLFQTDDGGWLQDAALLETMVSEKLNEDAKAIRAEGWKWIEVAPDFPYGHTYDLRRIRGEAEPMSEEEEASYTSLKAEYEKLEDDYAEADELPEEVDTRLGEIETAMEALQDRPIRFEADDYAIAGAFVSIDSSGNLRVERGYVRAEDEPAVETDEASDAGGDPAVDDAIADSDEPAVDPDEEEDDDGTKPLSDRLVCDLTVHRTIALRNALAGDPQLAMLACLHTMVLQLFYHYGQDSCIEITPKATHFGAQADGLGDTSYAQGIDQRIETWAANLPKAQEDLWDALIEWDSDSRDALFAHCVSMTVNAVQEPHYRKPRALAHADVLAATLGLDMAKAGWSPTAESYLGRVTKAQIVAAVREAKGEKDAERIAGFKKPDMVAAAEELLAGTDWLPQPLRTPPLVEMPDEPEFEIIDNGDVEPQAENDDAEEQAVPLEAAE
ncbi:ParB/RepB/Spo0J family partition protein [Agrobacterium tumefaciens]|uniref:ParB/RepB/Spo0J family partition protein n=1 Tax=Agrobacterium tumefaciens TaxID=358 RepID=UPI00157393BB|nr:ParB/RepB/Spo0J family partition protein [Agrobacterium tumefaciens]NSY51692.1 ParB/RepB/Spo0J family partition protein [Agrobacterium tumefaciens]NTA45955.1 ParB/RepB/Spo0J family partition protein [Agrobacterium tumefaciens]WCK16923.1 ParB/RepB/Spo0J family partition protein [Agrobacterium tumefaciens]WIE36283.1 ParB/RepB/Spo0J family partition protein [Agrobacterium tumefaciens]